MIRREFLIKATTFGLSALASPLCRSQESLRSELPAAETEKKRRAWAQEAFKKPWPQCATCSVAFILETGFFRDSIYYLLGPIKWWSNGNEPHVAPVDVPTHFVTDLASIPWEFYEYLQPTGPHAYAAVVHDYLYWEQNRPKEQADDILLTIMKEFGVRADKAWAIHKAVQDFGMKAWRDNARLKASGEGRILAQLPTDPKTNWSDSRKDHRHFADSHPTG